MENSFGAVYYNFPHAGVVQGFFDGHPFVSSVAAVIFLAIAICYGCYLGP